ncbi:retrotransposon gag domain, retroviral aspartyl protease [Tanacetum coccineum]
MSDMIACLNDLSYIPLNNKQNKPTQRYIGETSNDLTQAKRNKFEELYVSANEELYPDCDYVTRLDFMAKFTYFKLKCTEPDKMQHPVDGRAWKDFDTKYPDFVVEPRNVQLGVGKDIDVYLRPLIDDLNDLWAKPVVETIDVATDLKFNMRAACPTCNEDTPSVRMLGKTAYVGHRRFLMKPHKWRRSLEFNGETKNRDPPREFS